MNSFYKYALITVFFARSAYGDWHDDLVQAIEQGITLADYPVAQARGTESGFVDQLRAFQDEVAKPGIPGAEIERKQEALWTYIWEHNLGKWATNATGAVVMARIRQLAEQESSAELARLVQEERELKPFVQDAFAYIAANQPAQLLRLLENPTLAPIIRTPRIEARFINGIRDLIERANNKAQLNEIETLPVSAQFVHEFITPEQAAPLHQAINARRKELIAQEEAAAAEQRAHERREEAARRAVEAERQRQELVARQEAEARAAREREEAARHAATHHEPVAGPSVPPAAGIEKDRCTDQPGAIQEELAKAIETRTLWLPNKSESAQACDLLQKQQRPASWDRCAVELRQLPRKEEEFDISERIRKAMGKKSVSPITGESIEELVEALGTAYADYPLCEILRKCELKCKVEYGEEYESEQTAQQKLQSLLSDWEYKYITQDEDWDDFARRHMLPDTKTLNQQISRPVTTAKLIAKRLNLFVAAIEQDPKMVRGRATSEPGVLALLKRTILMEEGKKGDAKVKTRMSWCDCIEPVPRLASIIQMVRMIQHNHADKTEPLRLVSVASGELLHEYLLTKLLVRIGYHNIEFHLVDPKLSHDTLAAIGGEFENEPHVTFMPQNNAAGLMEQLMRENKQVDGVMIIDVKCVEPFTPDAHEVFARYARPGGFLYELMKDSRVTKGLYPLFYRITRK